jgi:hypothetical protein
MSDAPVGTAAPPPPPPSDHFVTWPLMVLLAAPICFVLMEALDPLIVPLIGPVPLMWWVVAALATAFWAARAAVQRHWRRAISTAILPIGVGATLCYFGSVTRDFRAAGDALHFAVVRPLYEAEIASLPKDQGPRFKRFSWDGFMLSPIEVVYDESDEVALLRGQQSDAWWGRANRNSEYGACAFAAKPLSGHFYLVQFSC